MTDLRRHSHGRGNLLHTLMRNLRFAIRRMAKSPGFTATAVLSLALGIGASTAIFSLVNAILLRELPLRAPEELVEIYESDPDFEYGVFSYPDYEDFRDGTGEVFSGVAATRLVPTQSDRDGSVESLMGEAVSGNLFGVLGVEAQIGRTLLPEDDVTPGGHPVVMLSHDYWQSRYGGDPSVVGQDIRIGGRPYAIVGVVPEAYSGSFRSLMPAFYAPIMMVNELMPGDSDQLEARGSHSVFVKARLRPGVVLPQAQSAADAVAASLKERDLDEWDPAGAFRLVPREEVILFPPMDSYIRAASVLLMVAVSLLVLMACTNLASFLLAKALDRRKEIALRLALGARRRSLVAQMLSESVVLGLLGGVAGIGLAYVLLRLLVNADLPLPLPINLDLSLDSTVLLFSLLLSLAAGFLLGLAPAFQNLHGDLTATLRNESPGAGQGGKLWLRNALVVSQVAMSLLLLLVAGLFVRSMDRIQSVDPGFGRQPTALLSFMVPTTRYDAEEGRALVERLVDRFEQIPGAGSIGLIDNLHLNPTNTQYIGFNVDGVEPPPEREFHQADRATVDPGFFAAAGIRIVQGRNFNQHDLADGQSVVIINEAMAHKLWPERDPVGQSLRTDDEQSLLIVGVASTAKVRSLGEAPKSFVYLPYSQSYSSALTAVVPSQVDPQRTVLDLVAAAGEIDPELFIWEAKTMQDHLGVVLLPARLSAFVLSAFAALALILAIIGLYGMVSYAVAQRRREVGIRMAIGADGGSVIRLLMSGGMKLVAIGTALGLLLALGVSRLLSGLLFELSALDPFTFLVWPLALGFTGAVAALLPARAASNVDPAEVLRAE